MSIQITSRDAWIAAALQALSSTMTDAERIAALDPLYGAAVMEGKLLGIEEVCAEKPDNFQVAQS